MSAASSPGHIILSDFATTGDGLVAALQVLAVLKRADRPVSETCHRFDPLPQILKNVRTRGGKPLEDPKVTTVIEGGRQRLGAKRAPRHPPVRNRAGHPRHGRGRRSLPRRDGRRRDRRRDFFGGVNVEA